MKKTKNSPEVQPVRARLKAIAKTRGETVQFVHQRYANERILHRLSRSPHGDRFILKGSTLFMLWTGAMHRATKDIDLLGTGDPSTDQLADVFREVCDTPPDEDDQLAFDSTSVIASDINAEKIYQGCRITLKALLGRSPIPVQIDIGFGDALSPGPLPMPDHETLLGLPGGTLRVYPQESVIAEKFHAMVMLGERNSRLKDFYDLWFLLTRFKFDRQCIARALTATFTRRALALPSAQPFCFSTGFFATTSRRQEWARFFKRQNKVFQRQDRALTEIPLTDVVALLKDFFTPLYTAEGRDTEGTWTPGGPWSALPQLR